MLTANAATGTVTYSADAGESNDVTLGVSRLVSSGSLSVRVSERGSGVTVRPPAGCSGTDNDYECPISSAAAVLVVNAGDGNDTVKTYSEAGVGSATSTVDGGDGNDTLAAQGLRVAFDGAAGNDKLSTDCIRGFTGCPPAVGADDVRGGPGTDAFEYAGGSNPSAVLSLNDQADDGAAGEGDNVHSDVENVDTTLGGATTVVGSDADNVVRGSGSIQGLGGNDTIETFGGNDAIDGGAGNDTLVGGGGDDRITGGTGVDSISGDASGPFLSTGNDTIAAADGAADRISCGLGADVATVDAIDVVDPNPQFGCETLNVVRSAQAPGGPVAPMTPMVAPLSARPAIGSTKLSYRAGRIAVIVRCRSGARCRGTLRVSTITPRRTIATAGYDVAATKSRIYRLSVGKNKRRYLPRAKRFRRVVVELRSRGASATTATKKLTLRRASTR